jgi:hypothetical protein
MLVAGRPAAGQQQAPEPVAPSTRLFDGLKFLAGGAMGLAIHESGHFMVDLAFDAHPHFHHAYLGSLPFFAIVHRGNLSPRREFVIAAAGFWMQDVASERLLMRRPSLRSTHAPFTKGEFAFDELTSIGYGILALARAGPKPGSSDRVIDTRGMASAVHVSEPLVGGLVLTPALLDGYRYFHPDARWAKWASRIAKTGTVLLLLK